MGDISGVRIANIGLKMVWGFGFDILSAQRCWWGCILYNRDIWREDSQNHRATDACANVCN